MRLGAAATTAPSDEQVLARDMIDVHGPQAAVVARDNARAAARAGQTQQAKSWLRVVGIIQRPDARDAPSALDANV